MVTEKKAELKAGLVKLLIVYALGSSGLDQIQQFPT
jgi:hypothetical protein